MMEAITGQLQTLMRQMANIQEEMGEMRAEREPRANEGRRNQAAPRQQRAQPWKRRRNGEEEYEENDYDEGGPDRRRFEQGRRDNRREDDNLGSIKSKMTNLLRLQQNKRVSPQVRHLQAVKVPSKPLLLELVTLSAFSVKGVVTLRPNARTNEQYW